MLGSLSAKYESSGNAATVSTGDGDGDAGGRSYGIYQFSGTMGVAQAFVEWLCQHTAPYDEYGRQLANSGNPAIDQSFADKWAEIGAIDPVGFGQLQDDYAVEQYFDPAADILSTQYGFAIRCRSNALQQVLFSNAIQHGPTYGAEVFWDAANLSGKLINSMTDADLIWSIYEVKLTDMSWSSGSPELRPGLFARWSSEREDALALL